MSSFAVMLKSRSEYLDGILVILDERSTAEQIAVEMRAKGLDVDVEEFRGTNRAAYRPTDRAR